MAVNLRESELFRVERDIDMDADNELSDGGRLDTGSRVTRRACLAALVACIGSFCMGSVIGFPSPAMPNLNANRNPFRTDDEENSWVGSVITLGALFGGLVGGSYMDRFGRKLGSMTIMLPWSIGWVIVVASSNVMCLYIGRALTGVCTGVISCIVPVYIGEIAPPAIRGILGTSHQLFVVLGILFAYTSGSFLSWNWLAIASSVFCNLFVVGMLFMPETPRWLYRRGHKIEAELALKWFHGDVDVSAEMRELEKIAKNYQETAKMKEFLEPILYKPLLISLGLMVFQQFSGINVVMFYTVRIFQMAGSEMDPNMQTIVVGIVGVIGTLVSIVVIDLAGRRVLLLASGAIMCISIGGMGAFFYELEFNELYAKESLGWLPLACLVIFNFGFNVAYGPVPWLMMGEIFPPQAKGRASSISTAFNWLCAFLLTKFFVNVTSLVGVYGGYWLMSAFCFLSLIFVILFVPETKGRTLEDIERLFK